MIYGFSLLFMILGLIVGITALRKIIYMGAIRKNSRITTGTVVSRKSANNTAGWLMGMVSATEVVNHERPLIAYQLPGEKELSVEVIPSNFLSARKYQVGEAVDVAYDLSEPWRAYSVREWAAAARDLWFGTAISIVAVFLWILGRVYHLPF